MKYSETKFFKMMQDEQFYSVSNFIPYNFQEFVQYFSSSTTINTNGTKLRKITSQKV